MKISEILMASNIFASKGEMLRAIKNKGVKLNRVAVDSADDLLENGDLLNAWRLPHGIELIKRKIVVVQHGKKCAFVQLVDDVPKRIELT